MQPAKIGLSDCTVKDKHSHMDVGRVRIRSRMRVLPDELPLCNDPRMCKLRSRYWSGSPTVRVRVGPRG